MIKPGLTTTAVIVFGLAGCTTVQLDTTELESKIAAVEGDAFGTCMNESHEAGVQLDEARARLAKIQGGSLAESELEAGLAAADMAAEHRSRAEAACAQLMEPIEGRVAVLESGAVDVNARLASIESVREILQGVTFATGSAQLTASARTVLDVQANKLKRRPGVPVEVAGFASSTGDPQRNLILSQQRAEAVRAFLVERGVEGTSITARGYGIENPIASNDTEAGRRANQRIELRYLTE